MVNANDDTSMQKLLTRPTVKRSTIWGARFDVLSVFIVLSKCT
jgi:hypothetical protein